VNNKVLDPNTYLEGQIHKALNALLGEEGGQLPIPLDRPRQPEHGDLGLPCFPYAKALGTNPAQAAKNLAEHIPLDEILSEVQPTGPFLNFRFNREALAKNVIRGILEGIAPYGPWPSNDLCVVIDFSSPNIAKPFHLGHLRSTVIGAALRRLYRFTGHEVHGINHLGDWGSQFGKIIVAWREWGNEEALTKDPMRHLFEIYVRYQKEEKERPELKERAAEAFRRLESGAENDERTIWRKLRDISLKAFQGPYGRLHVEFDHMTGESFYEDKMESVVEKLEEAGITTLSEGALVVEFPEQKIPPCILRKSDGTTIYATRDLAALFYRRETYKFNKALYVVGSEQKLHFRQLALVLEKLNWPQAKDVQHIDFGLILFFNEEKGRWEKGKTRSGNAIFLDEVLDEAVAGVRKIIEEKNPDLPEKEAIAEAVGVSAIIFNDLKNGRIKDVKFDWDEMLSFEGETGPYVQYAGARLSSILRKANTSVQEIKDKTEIDYSLLEDAGTVLLTMMEFGPTLKRAVEKNEPSTLTSLMIRIASEIHSYLRDHRVLGEDEEVTKARLALVAAGRKILETGLEILGVSVPERM
jgi:arginyl-tRNA synthetase